jgi:ABC-type transport system involved in multi-copper enzyme maturation permease subunit
MVTTTRRPAPPAARAGFGQVLRAEWTKFRSVRGTAICLVVAIGLTVLFSALVASGTTTDVSGSFKIDRFQFVHQPLSGDGTIVARVTSQEAIGPWAKAGVIVKASMEQGSPYAAMMLTPGNGVRFQADYNTDVPGSASGPPRWLKLTRTGQSVAGFESADGVAWTRVGSITLAGLPETTEVGLFATAPAVGMRSIRRGGMTANGPEYRTSTATFDNVSLAPVAAAPPGQWVGETVGDVIRNIDGTPVTGQASQAGDVFTVSGVGDITDQEPAGDNDTAQNSLSGVLIGLIAVVVLGSLFITTEYARGTIRTTFALSPRRGRVLAAKALVLGLATLGAGLVACLAAFWVTQPILHDNGFVPPAYEPLSLSDPKVLRAVVGSAAVMSLVALFSLGVGAIMRRAAGTITLVIALVVVPPLVAEFMPLSVDAWIRRVTPLAGLAIQQTRDRFDHVIGPWAGLGVLVAYALAALAVGFVLIRRRDA